MDENETTNKEEEQQQEQATTADVSAEIAALKQFYEDETAKLRKELETEKAAHVRDMREMIMGRDSNAKKSQNGLDVTELVNKLNKHFRS